MGMSLSKTCYIYNTHRPLSPEEQRVIAAGYPYVSTTILQRCGVGVDRLLDHSHHSKNTHLIVSGSIDIGKSRDGDFKFRRITYGPGDWVPLSSDVEYRGEAGDEGCVFVEGHGVLSPTTADRFEGRGTIVRVREGTPGAFSAC